MTKLNLKEGSILGIYVTSTSIGQLLDYVQYSLKNKKKFFITTPNPEMVVEANNNRLLKRAINTSSVKLPDGFGLILANKLLNTDTKLVRIPGRNMLTALLDLANKQNLKVYFLGQIPKINARAVAKAKRDYPNAVFAGSGQLWLNIKGEPVAKADYENQETIIAAINKFKPDLLFVAFGAPKQELWVAKHFSNLRVGGVMVVGGALDYFVGSAKLPPTWLAGLGLEWLWRLIREPRRIGRIYKAIVVFPVLVIKEKLWPAN